MHPYPSDPCEADCRCPQSVPIPTSFKPSTLHPPRTAPSRQTSAHKLTDLPAINYVRKKLKQPTPPVIPRTKTAPPIHVRGVLTKSPVFTKPLPVKTAPFKPPQLDPKPCRPRPIKTAPQKPPQKHKKASNLPLIRIQPVRALSIQTTPTRYPCLRPAPLGRHLVTFADLEPAREEQSPEPKGPQPLIEIVLPRPRSCDVICTHQCQMLHYEGFSRTIRLH